MYKKEGTLVKSTEGAEDPAIAGGLFGGRFYLIFRLFLNSPTVLLNLPPSRPPIDWQPLA